jgi:hypothetical protein
VARLIGRFPAIADQLAAGGLSIRALVELREVLTDENRTEVLARAEGMSQKEAQLLAVEYKPRPIPRDVVRALPMPAAPPAAGPAVPAGPAGTRTHPHAASPAVPAETKTHPPPPEFVRPLTPDLRRLNVTVSAEFMAELEQVRAALSHQCPEGNFEQVVREAFKLVLERDRKRKGLTDRPRASPETPGENDRYVPAAVKRAVLERDQGRCTWPMGDGELCGTWDNASDKAAGPATAGSRGYGAQLIQSASSDHTNEQC